MERCVNTTFFPTVNSLCFFDSWVNLLLFFSLYMIQVLDFEKKPEMLPQNEGLAKVEGRSPQIPYNVEVFVYNAHILRPPFCNFAIS